VDAVARTRVAVGAGSMLVVAYAVAVIVAVPRQGTPPTTYAGAFRAAEAIDLIAGLGLLFAGVLAWVDARTRRVGTLAVLAGAAWFGPDWEGWDGGPAVVRSLGALTWPLALALVFQLGVTFPSGRIRSRLQGGTVAAVYGIAVLVVVGRALFRDPLLDLYCWRNCLDNSFLVHADPGLARTVDDVWLRSAIAVGLLLTVIVVRRLRRLSPAGWRTLAPVLVPVALIGAVEATYAAALIHTPFENPSRSEFGGIFLARGACVTALAAGLVLTVLRVLRTRLAVSTLITELASAPRPGTLRKQLAAALGDPRLEVAYWLPGLERYVDGDGRTVEPPASGNGRVATPISRRGRIVALVAHDAALDSRDLEHEIGASARLVVDNERLRAEALAQLADLRASQARIVETADAERRRLERDLHDGAQQQLLGLAYDLRIARAGAEAHGDRDLTELLDTAVADAQAAFDQLRELAHGIFPAVLAEGGLQAALPTLADVAPVAVVLRRVTSRRYSAVVETAAYAAVVEAVEDAAARAAGYLQVEAWQDGDTLVVGLDDDGSERRNRIISLDDRVGALGGSVETGARTLRVVIPCG
jgi:signal transduction histidine kinase